MECTHGELRTGFADRLCCNDADGFADGNGLSRCAVAAVALCTDAVFAAAGEDRAALDAGDACFNDAVTNIERYHFVFADDELVRFGIANLRCGEPAENTVAERFKGTVAVADGFKNHAVNRHAAFRKAVLFANDDVVGNVNKTSCEVTGVRGAECGIGKTFARTVGTDEELKNGEAFTEVCTNRNLDDLSARVRHEAAHTGKLTNLVG